MALNLIALIDDYLDDELDEVSAERLRVWLDGDPRNVRTFVRRIYLHRQLRDSLVADNINRCLAASDELTDESRTVSRSDERATQTSPDRAWFYITLASALLLGAIVGSGVTWKVATRWAADRGQVVLVPGTPDAAAMRTNPTPYVATLVNVTNCRWDQTRSTAELTRGGGIRPGESLHLLEGLAEISSKLPNGGVVALQLEGPLAMSLSNDGTPSLLYGRLTGRFTCEYDRFTLNTPLGLVIVSGEASIGVMAAPNRVEVHVFSGAASLDSWAVGLGGEAKHLTAAAGSSLCAQAGTDGRVTIDRSQSRESWFMTPATVEESRLSISADYVGVIKNAKPAAYWRFERCVDGLMENEMGNHLHCRMVGNAVRWHPGNNGGTVEFGLAAGPGYLISDETLDSLSDSYAVELWAKPTFYHHGMLVSLIQWTAPQSPIGRHRMALELCGPASWFSSPYRVTDTKPGRIRFIHECRTGYDVDCFSPDPYTVRQWQHLVAVKTPSETKLYANGRLLHSENATGSLPSGLRIFMGQHMPVSPGIKDEVASRLFVGELDEVAVYDRVLSKDEIKRHFESVHPKLETKGEKGALP